MESTGKSYKLVRTRFCILLAALRRELPFRQFRAVLRLTWCADRFIRRSGSPEKAPPEWVEEMNVSMREMYRQLEWGRVERVQIRRLVHIFRHLFSF